LPRSVWRLRERSSPPSAAVAWRDLSSSTSVDMAAAFVLKTSAFALMEDLSVLK